MLDNEILKNKIALVTGSSRGIGKAIAINLAKAGAIVIIVYKNNKFEALRTGEEIKKYTDKSSLLSTDVSKSDQVSTMAKSIVAQFGTIDILVNNAGIAKSKELDTITEQDWDETIDNNLKSVFLVTQAVIPHMKKQNWGRIINISSTAAQLGGIIGPHYTASKAGIIGLTHSYASQLVSHNITVNTICPALIETDMIKDNSKVIPDRIPVGRLGSVDEISNVVLMLAQNGYITGQTINVNGGLYFT